MFRQPILMLDGNDAAGGNTPPPATDPQVPTDWDSYVAALPEDQRGVVERLYTEKNQALLNTVKDTRKERDTLARELRDAAKKMEDGSDAQIKLNDTATALDEANKRADFYEEAPAHLCNNPKVAFTLAKANDLFTRTGTPDWKAIEQAAPQLFGVTTKPKGKGQAGAGTTEQPAETINDFIRKRAGIAS